MQYRGIYQTVTVLAIIIFSVIILVYGKPFLFPLTMAALLAMLLLPFSHWVQSKGAGKGLAALLSILLIVAFFALVALFIGWQLSDFTNNASKMEQQFSQKYKEVQTMITEKMGIPQQKQEQMFKEQQASSGGKIASTVGAILKGIGGILANTLLVLVYTFLLLYFRGRLKKFLIKLVPDKDEQNAMEIINSIQKVTQKYLTGLFFMIVGLWIMYGIGYSIVGIKNPVFFAVLCGILEIIPFIGNLVGTLLTLLMSMVDGGGTTMIIGILITYGVVQFLQSYILEPLVVGAEVNINPLFTIVALIAGELLWGVSGMVVAIPLLAIAKIICDHIEPLKPYGYLIGQDEKKKGSMFDKLKKKFASKSK